MSEQCSASMKEEEILDRFKEKVRNCIQIRGFYDFSKTQREAIPHILNNEHVLLIAPTGTGKTESAMLPVFNGMLDCCNDGFAALYITPLRSLNRDILDRMEWWCKHLGISIGVRHGDTSSYERRKQSLSPPKLLITTPETIQAMFMGKRLREHLKNIRYVIIDEIHELAGSKRGSQLSVALERLVEYAGEFQRIGLSATVGNPKDVASFMCGNRDSRIVEIPVSPYLDISVVFGGENIQEQSRAVENCIDKHGSSLIFVNTRVTAELIGHQLYDRGDIEVHHGSLSKEIRLEAEKKFKNGDIKALICTSSMELGIDIGHVEHVIQFGSPREVSRLVQRVGRAGHRRDTISTGTIIATGFDDLLESLVIIRKACGNECEDVKLHKDAADVLANQISAILVEYGEIKLEKLKAMISRSTCFNESDTLIESVCMQMERQHLIGRSGSVLRKYGRTRKYLTSNLSMIHDEKKMRVIDMVSRKTVGTLDESFAAAWLHTGATFITKGQVWRVLDMEEDRIVVEPAINCSGDVPSWEGEQIPVPYSVANESGMLRRNRRFSDYTSSKNAVDYAERFIGRMDRPPKPVPSDNTITIESTPDGAVINICAGHKTNEVIARALSILLSARYGTSVGIEVNAYRFLLRLPPSVGVLDVHEILISLAPGHVSEILRMALKRTTLFRWKLIQIAKKFGAIDHDADYNRISIHRLTELFENTVIADEAYRELFIDYMNIENAEMVLGMIHSGEIGVTMGALSPLGSEGLFSSHDLLRPPEIDQAVITTLKNRLENEEIILFCMHCKKWKSRTKVKRVPEVPRCPSCGAGLIAVLKPYEEELIGLAKRGGKTENGRDAVRVLMKNANIVLSSGKKAVTTLAAKGVGPDTASRIISTMSEGDVYYREILKAEKQYLRTRRFW